MTDWKPVGYSTCSPYLVVNGAQRVIDFAKAAFGALELRRYDMPDGSIMHAEIRIGDSVVMLGDAGGNHHAFASMIHVYVQDVDRVYAAALDAGATEIEAPKTREGDPDRRGSFKDPCGNTWAVASQLEKHSKFRVGRLDHVHIRVPNRDEAAEWYAKHLGFEPVDQFKFWAEGFEGGPLQISADGGQTTLALFEASEGHPMIPQKTGVAFNLTFEHFAAFARALPNEIRNPDGRPLIIDDVVDFDMCWAYNLADPWGNVFELNSYEYDRVKRELIEADNVNPTRYWPRSLYEEYVR